MAYSGSRSP
ncbi:hypothetical protein YPPY46_0926, partial [Yersinia pestis PY-46]